MTAAEAAAAVAAHKDGNEAAAQAAPGDGEDGPCATDDDCTFTRFAPNACCPMLCAPRAVTRKAGMAAEEKLKSCAQGHECPQPSCHAPRFMTVPACVQSKCVTKVRNEKGVP